VKVGGKGAWGKRRLTFFPSRVMTALPRFCRHYFTGSMTKAPKTVVYPRLFGYYEPGSLALV
jgi:hypothetical protein